jgi:hypothetical protein
MAGQQRGLWGYFFRLLDRAANYWQAIAATGILGVGVVTGWAASAVDALTAYAPLCWVIAGLLGALLAAAIFFAVQLGVRLWIRNRWNVLLMAQPEPINPVDKTFENRRIRISEMVVPSHRILANKTFIDCEIVGPANLYWFRGNAAAIPHGPKIDAVYLEPKTTFYNGIVLDGCIFRNCSFFNITLFVGADEYHRVKSDSILNWISETPDSIAEKSTPLLSPPSSTPGFRTPSDTEGKTPP